MEDCKRMTDKQFRSGITRVKKNFRKLYSATKGHRQHVFSERKMGKKAKRLFNFIYTIAGFDFGTEAFFRESKPEIENILWKFFQFIRDHRLGSQRPRLSLDFGDLSYAICQEVLDETEYFDADNDERSEQFDFERTYNGRRSEPHDNSIDIPEISQIFDDEEEITLVQKENTIVASHVADNTVVEMENQKTPVLELPRFTQRRRPLKNRTTPNSPDELIGQFSAPLNSTSAPGETPKFSIEMSAIMSSPSGFDQTSLDQTIISRPTTVKPKRLKLESPSSMNETLTAESKNKRPKKQPRNIQESLANISVANRTRTRRNRENLHESTDSTLMACDQTTISTDNTMNVTNKTRRRGTKNHDVSLNSTHSMTLRRRNLDISYK